jgi:hypothetical protein
MIAVVRTAEVTDGKQTLAFPCGKSVPTLGTSGLG